MTSLSLSRNVHFFLLFLFIILTSCDNKRSTYHDLLQLQTELQTNSSHYTEDEWIDFFNKLESLHQRMEKYDYTPAERKEIGRIEGEMAAHFTKKVINEFKKEAENFFFEASGFIEGFKQSFDKSINTM